MFAPTQMKCSPRSLASSVRGPGLQRRDVGRRPVLAAAAQEPVAAVDRDRGWGARAGVERIARVGAAHVRADRAAQAGRVAVRVAEPVCGRVRRVVRVGSLDERRAAGPAADHLRCQRDRVGGARRLAHEPPEAGHVLLHLAHDQVAAVAAEVVAAGGRVDGQHVLGIGVCGHERAVREQAVLVGVAEHELARADDVLGRPGAAEAGDDRLGDAVAEAEVLAVADRRGVEPVHLGHAALRIRRLDRPVKLLERRRRPARRAAAAGRPHPWPARPTPIPPARSRRRRPARGCGRGRPCPRRTRAGTRPWPDGAAPAGRARRP